MILTCVMIGVADELKDSFPAFVTSRRRGAKQMVIITTWTCQS